MTPEPTEEPPVLPNHPAYQQILNAFAETPGPKRARDLCQVLDLPLTPKTIAQAQASGQPGRPYRDRTGPVRPAPPVAALRSEPPVHHGRRIRHPAHDAIASARSCGATASL